MMTLMMRHMLLNGHLAEQTPKKPQNSTGTGSQNPSCSALLKAWPTLRTARFIDANSYAVASPLIIVGETEQKNKQKKGDGQVPLTILCIS